MNQAEKIYKSLYAFLCGQHPYLYFWHDQWLATKDLYRHLHYWLPQLEGKVLDVGCGTKPYQTWLTNATTYLGIDLPTNPIADVHIQPNTTWHLPDASFDAVICNQVIEHVQNLPHILSEIRRTLKPSGRLVLSAPFIYNLHGIQDYRRFSADELCELLSQDYLIIDLVTEGGIGSTLGILFLNWLELSCQQWLVTRWLKAFLLPVWIILSGVVNTVGYLWDKVDTTNRFYSNVLVVAMKR